MENMALVLGKRNILRLDLNESREGFCRRGRGRSFRIEGPKTEKGTGTNIWTGRWFHNLRVWYILVGTPKHIVVVWFVDAVF